MPEPQDRLHRAINDTVLVRMGSTISPGELLQDRLELLRGESERLSPPITWGPLETEEEQHDGD